MKYASLLLPLLLCGCGRYADFTLPAVQASTHPATYSWTPQPNPVLARSANWDSVDALNPAVIVGRDGRLFNFYSGFDGRTWHTGLATSTDGLSWQKEGRVLSPTPKPGKATTSPPMAAPASSTASTCIGIRPAKWPHALGTGPFERWPHLAQGTPTRP